MKQARQDAKEALKRAADLEIPTRFEPYQLGDKVWLEGHNLTTTHPTAKLAPRRYGPFMITHVISRTSYQLKLPSQWKIHNVFHATLLTPYKEMTLNGSHNQEPALELINGQPEWEVEQILCVRRYQCQVQYLIRWKGFSEAHDSWEPAANVHADKLIQEFYKRYPKAIRNTTIQTPIFHTPVAIRRTIMSTPTLTEHITDPPNPLTLAEHLADDPSYIPDSPVLSEEVLVPINTRPPSRAHSEPSEAEVDIGMIGRDLTTPAGFCMFDRTDPNHHRYGQKIDMPDSTSRWPHYIQFIVDTDSHNHYVYATRDDLRHVKYGWVLEAAPFTSCTSPGVDESDLQVLLGSEDQRLGVDIALNTINDKGVTADTDRLREIATEDVDLTRGEHELANECNRWRVRNAEVRSRLIQARVHLRIHPYLNHTALIPDQY